MHLVPNWKNMTKDTKSEKNTWTLFTSQSMRKSPEICLLNIQIVEWLLVQRFGPMGWGEKSCLRAIRNQKDRAWRYRLRRAVTHLATESHTGTHFKLSARHQMHPSPQRTPVIFQAGTSKSGQAFAARHAEAIYIGGMVPSHAAGQIKVSQTHSRYLIKCTNLNHPGFSSDGKGVRP